MLRARAHALVYRFCACICNARMQALHASNEQGYCAGEMSSLDEVDLCPVVLKKGQVACVCSLACSVCRRSETPTRSPTVFHKGGIGLGNKGLW